MNLSSVYALICRVSTWTNLINFWITQNCNVLTTELNLQIFIFLKMALTILLKGRQQRPQTNLITYHLLKNSGSGDIHQKVKMNHEQCSKRSYISKQTL